MELKHILFIKSSKCQNLLIVPYGIETINGYAYQLVTELLIVPYGIETNVGPGLLDGAHLLSVPYGIETEEPH